MNSTHRTNTPFCLLKPYQRVELVHYLIYLENPIFSLHKLAQRHLHHVASDLKVK
jgi:hypothetical protein